MTVADVIRNMSDIELAQFLNFIVSERDHIMSERLKEQGVENTLVEFPHLSIAHHLKFLQGPAEEVFDWEEEYES